MKQYLRHILLGFWLMSILVLAVATTLEKWNDSDFVSQHFYQSPFFIIMWILLIINGLVIVIQEFFIKKNYTILGIYGSFLLILVGALITCFCSHKGTVHLKMSGENEFNDMEIPFDFKLTNSEQIFYTGTQTPSDFVSSFQIIDGNVCETAIVSMNRIYKYKGYRFCQTAIDADQSGTVLSVSYDPGAPVTYSGYVLFLVSFILFLIQKKGRYRVLLQKLTIIILLLSGSITTPLLAQRTISVSQADKMGSVAMQYNGRICPLETYCNDVCYKIYGKKTYKEFNSVQVVTGWIFFPEDWFTEPMFKISDKDLCDYLQVEKYASLANFFDKNGNYKFENKESFQHLKGLKKAEEQLGTIQQLRLGSLLKIFPDGNQWLAPIDDYSVYSADSLYIRHFFRTLSRFIQQQNEQDFQNSIQNLVEYQAKHATIGTISPQKLRIERLYNRFRTDKILFIINLLCACVAFAHYVRHILTKKSHQYIPKLLFVIMCLSLFTLLINGGVRWYISGHIPLSNEYETLLFCATMIASITLLFWKKHEVLPFGGFLLSGFTLLLASIKVSNPQITSLTPILHSPWLTIHVSIIMIAYACLGFTLIYSIIALISKLFVSNNLQINTITILSKIFLYPAVGLLAAGIITGSFWANISWGNYWHWDPKEVWALITLLLYGIPIHENLFPIFQKPHYYHAYMIIAFISLLMTYFGVNLFLGGVHSYAM